ncbi:hypothetical protein AgCh_007161 [Apium graveolens]
MFSKKLLIVFVVISALIGVMNCTQTEEKVYGEGICQYPENCTQPQVPPPSTDQPYDVPPPKPKVHPPKPSIPEQPVPTGYSPYTTTTPPPPPPAPSAYPEICPPPPSPPAAEGQYTPDSSSSIPPPNPYTYLNDTTDSADAPLSAFPLFSLTTLFLFAYYA